MSRHVPSMLLALLGAGQVLFGVSQAAALGALWGLDPSWRSAPIPPGFVLVLFGAVAVLLGVATLGVAAARVMGAPWARSATILLALLYVPTGCGAAAVAALITLGAREDEAPMLTKNERDAPAS